MTFTNRFYLLASLFYLFCLGCVSSPKPQNPAEMTENINPTEEKVDKKQIHEPKEPSFRLSDNIIPLSYDIHLTTNPAEDNFTGKVEITIDLKKPTKSFFLHSKHIKVNQVQVTAGNVSINASVKVFENEEQIGVFFKKQQKPQIIKLKINYTASLSKDLDGLYRVIVDETPYLFTQMEPIAARTLMPCFDEPQFKTPFKTTLVVPKGLKAISNMPVLEKKIQDDWTHFTFLPSPPLPTYLLAVMIGPFDEVLGPSIPATDLRPQAISLRGFAVKNKGAQLKYALENTGKILLALESYFGIAHPYPKIDIIAVPDFGAGAMENPGAITFREWLLLLDEEEAGINQKRAFFGVMTHELVHQWFGNYVTLSWWNDLWLNEAFATFLGRKITNEVYPESEAMIQHVRSSHSVMNSDSIPAARKIRQAIQSHHDIHNAFDGITYSKGAAFLSMIENHVGEANFKNGISEFLRQHANAVATADDLLFAIENQSQTPITGLSKTFLEQAGVPQITVKSSCENSKANFELSQKRYFKLGLGTEEKPIWEIPVCFKLNDDEKQCVLFNKEKDDFGLENCPKWFFPNKGAHGYFRFVISDEDNNKLIKNIDLLTIQEKLALADSLKAAFRSGSMTFDALLPYLNAYAQMPERVLSIAFKDILFFAHETVWDKRPPIKFQQFIQQIYFKTFKKVSYTPLAGESDEIKLHRAALFDILYHIGQHRGIKKWLKKKGKKLLLAKERNRDTSFLPVELRTLAIDVLLKDPKQSKKTFVRVSQLLEKEESPDWRRVFIRSLGKTPHLEHYDLILKWLEADRLRKNERGRIFWSLMDNTIFRQQTWQLFTDRYEHYKTRLPKGTLSYTPYLPGAFCDIAIIKELEEFFKDKVDGIPGAPRNLRKSIENIKTCHAMKNFHSDNLIKTYGKGL